MLLLRQVAASCLIHLGLENIRFRLLLLLSKATVFAQESLRKVHHSVVACIVHVRRSGIVVQIVCAHLGG